MPLIPASPAALAPAGRYAPRLGDIATSIRAASIVVTAGVCRPPVEKGEAGLGRRCSQRRLAAKCCAQTYAATHTAALVYAHSTTGRIAALRRRRPSVRGRRGEQGYAALIEQHSFAGTVCPLLQFCPASTSCSRAGDHAPRRKREQHRSVVFRGNDGSAECPKVQPRLLLSITRRRAGV